MSHPLNKRDRFLISVRKGNKRVNGYWRNFGLTEASMKRGAQLRRNTTKLCSCMICGNPRRKYKELTMQEKKFYSRVEQSGNSLGS